VEVLGGVLVLRRVAASDVAALQAKAQMDPGVMHLKALLAALAAGCDSEICFLDVLTNASHEPLFYRTGRTVPLVAHPDILLFVVPVMEDTGSSTRHGRMWIQKLPVVRFDDRPNQ
jgi:hypothetical protein